jgi:tetratricopeptide (TPR) repeat protein
MTITAAYVAVWLAIAPAGGAGEQDDREANPHFVEARDAFEAEDWDAAARAFAAAYVVDGRAEYLYAQAQAERRGGRCEDAIATYARFIEAGPPAEAIADARDNIAKCEQERPRAPPPQIVVAPPPRQPSAPPTRETVVARRWYRDPWGGIATSAGVACAAAGGALLGVAHERERNAATAVNEQGYRDAISDAPAMSRAGIGLLSAGAALLVTGIVRWSVLAAGERRRARRF